MEINPLLIGLKADATKEQIEARLLELNRKAGEADSLKEQAVAEEKRKHDAEIKAIIDKAVTEKRIQESQRKNFEDFAAANFESFKSAIEGLHPIGAISKELNTSSSKPELGDKDYGWYLENDVKALEKMEKDEPEKFEALVDAYYQ